MLENVYEEAIAYEFDKKNIKYKRQKPIELKYKTKKIGFHKVDFLVEKEVILELKATEKNPIYT